MDEKSNSPKTRKVKSAMLRMGRKTIFFDVNIAQNNKKYLRISESRFVGEEKDSVRNTLVLFPEEVGDFAKSLKEMVVHLG